MLHYPHIDPVALRLGPLSVHWYGIMYLLAFIVFIFLGKRAARNKNWLGMTPGDVDDLLTWGVFGVIIGGRLGQVIFYDPIFYFTHPLEIFAVWKGGMSFHGGLIGVIVSLWFWSHKHVKRYFDVMDFVAPLVPQGLMWGRLGNFINGELWGRQAPADLPWAMIFDFVDALPRHPSQLYEALFEGLLLWLVMSIYSTHQRPRGAVSGMLLLGYGIARSFCELFREPDDGIFGRSYEISMGQWLCVPMMIAGIYLIVQAYRNNHKKAYAK